MNRRRAILGGLAAVAGLLAGGLGFLAGRDTVEGRIRARIVALLPAVERALGESVPGPIRVVVASREELVELRERRNRDLLAAVEGAPPESSEGVTGLDALGILAGPVELDGDGAILVCREEMEGAPYEGGTGEIFDRIFGVGWGRRVDPGALDRNLVLLMVEAYQDRVLGSRAWLRGARHRGDLLARRAVLEGHAYLVAARVLEGGAEGATPPAPATSRLSPIVTRIYSEFDAGISVRRAYFPVLEGRVFVQSAMARLGQGEALRRLIAEPPSLHQIERPDSWPGARAPDAGTDGALRRARPWLAEELQDLPWGALECDPVPTLHFLDLLEPASPGAVQAAAGALLEVQRIQARGNDVRGHLLAARDESGAEAVRNAWVEAARARDALVPEDPKQRFGRVLESAWSEGEIDGLPVLFAERRYSRFLSRLENAAVLRCGRFVLELRLVDDPGGQRALRRIIRGLLACLGEGPEEGDPRAAAREERWRFAIRPASPAPEVRGLLVDPDPDVRLAAFRNLRRRGELSDGERERGRADPDPLLRLAALTGAAPGEEPPEADLLAALEDADPWVAAGGWCAARSPVINGSIPTEAFARALDRPDAEVRRAASRLLDPLVQSVVEPEAILALVRRALADRDAGVRDGGAQALLFMPGGAPGLGEVFSGMLSGGDEELARAALIQLSIREGVPGVAGALVPYLEREEHAGNAIEALGRQGAEALPAVPALRRVEEEAARAGDTGKRLAALVAVARITGGRMEALSVLEGILRTGTDQEARHAVTAAGELDVVADLVPELAARLPSKDRGLVMDLLGTLEHAAFRAEEALPAILPLCGSGDPVLAAAARRARDRIEKDVEERSGR